MQGLAPGKRLRIFDAYIEAREALERGEITDAQEALSISDFPTYLGKFIRHTFLNRFDEVTGQWPSYTRPTSLEDFEEYTSSRFGRFSDIPERGLNAPYEELTLKEFGGPGLRLREWGAAITITRQLIISDRLNKLSEIPTLMAEAMARTISKRAAVTTLQSNPTMFDGNALISSQHGNIVTTALAATAQGATDLITADLKFDAQTDDEGFKVIVPGGRSLIIPQELRFVARALNENDLLPNGSSQLERNLAQGLVDKTIIEPFLTDANNYYLLADPTGAFAPIAAITLNGETTPFIGLKDPGVRAVLGGNDPYSFEFDDIKYKVRHDYDFAAVEWRGLVGGIVA